MIVLTARQLELLRFIVVYWRREKMAPTLGEMGEALGIKQAAVCEHVDALEHKGYVQRLPNTPRTVEALHDPDNPSVCPMCGHEREPAA